ncbi:hypothetical protein [Miniphocaeibacter massiliensis]|uniref:hypothetical protein n=1 Tax=Miniphocaeibacter massiliensis TaxID=2041841 RepID=UPI000C1C4924|nr:hypothetical protein [Miniphocaeibacter massiliensis]
MKKKFLILGLIMVMAFTACGDKKDKETENPSGVNEITSEEEKDINEFLEGFNKDPNTLFSAELVKEDRTINIEILSQKTKLNVEVLRNSINNISKAFVGEISKGFTIKLYYKGEENTPLMIVKDEKVIEDNFEEYLRNNPDKEDKTKKE